MRQHIIPGVIAATVAIVTACTISVGTISVMQKPRQLLMTNTGKQMPDAWGELSQPEIDALTATLKGIKPKEVAIFCASRNCDDMALDFDNAFESAHWVSGIERPLVDSNTGVSVGPDDEDGRTLAAAIESATKGRIKPNVVASHLIGGRMAIIISKPAR